MNIEYTDSQWRLSYLGISKNTENWKINMTLERVVPVDEQSYESNDPILLEFIEKLKIGTDKKLDIFNYIK